MAVDLKSETIHSPVATISDERASAFGFLRLLFASLVIVSHVPEQIDGNRSRELLSQVTGMSFGELAVDGFFLVSGYLIARSFIASATVGDYFIKRILRIYPAFLVAFAVSILIVAPLGGADLRLVFPRDWLTLCLDVLRLKPPELAGSFPANPMQSLNAPTWTIAFEFRAYILAALWGLLGLYRGRSLLAAITAVLLVAHVLYRAGYAYPVSTIPGLGETFKIVRLEGMFMVGTCFYLYRDRVPIRTSGALIASVLLLICFAYAPFNEIGVAVAGGYLTFWAARVAPVWLKRIGSKNDISYGYYLYAWPATQLMIRYIGHPSILLAMLADFGIAAAAGTVSWFAVERWCARLKPTRQAPAHK